MTMFDVAAFYICHTVQSAAVHIYAELWLLKSSGSVGASHCHNRLCFQTFHGFPKLFCDPMFLMQLL